MLAAAPGHTVRFNYVGKLDDGSTFDSTEGAPPIKALLGDGSLVQPLEQALLGMAPGDKKTFRVAAEDAFGPRRDDLVRTVPRDQIQDHGRLAVGSRLTASNDDGQRIQLIVVALNDATAVLDGNHPLAGQDLTIELEMVEVVPGASA